MIKPDNYHFKESSPKTGETLFSTAVSDPRDILYLTAHFIREREATIFIKPRLTDDGAAKEWDFGVICPASPSNAPMLATRELVTDIGEIL